MSETMRWRIGSPDGHSADLVDTYKQPNLLGDVTWTVGAQGQRWPLFHPSEADPLGGYRPHPYTVAFALDHAPRGAYLLRVAYLTIAPRLGRLELTVNGTVGRAYPRPSPSRSGEIQLLAGLHTAIYAEGVEAVYVAFPFDLPGAAVYSDAQLGWVHWDQDELPGGCKEWLPLQSGVLVRDAEASVLLLSPDIPLFCVGDIVRGRWPKEADLMGGRILILCPEQLLAHQLQGVAGRRDHLPLRDHERPRHPVRAGFPAGPASAAAALRAAHEPAELPVRAVALRARGRWRPGAHQLR